jgi:hypothetical protein
MPYVDTSIIIAALIEEERSGDADGILGDPGNPVWISDWTVTEAASALALKVRHGTIRERNQQAARHRLEILVRKSLRHVALEPFDFRRAAALCDHHALNLRAGDALHLAIAERIGVELVTFDTVQAAAGAALGIAARVP